VLWFSRGGGDYVGGFFGLLGVAIDGGAEAGLVEARISFDAPKLRSHGKSLLLALEEGMGKNSEEFLFFVSKRNGDAVTYLAGLLSQYCAFDFLFNSCLKRNFISCPAAAGT
jgi:hypothetical protein